MALKWLGRLRDFLHAESDEGWCAECGEYVAPASGWTAGEDRYCSRTCVVVSNLAPDEAPPVDIARD